MEERVEYLEEKLEKHLKKGQEQDIWEQIRTIDDTMGRESWWYLLSGDQLKRMIKILKHANQLLLQEHFGIATIIVYSQEEIE